MALVTFQVRPKTGIGELGLRTLDPKIQCAGKRINKERRTRIIAEDLTRRCRWPGEFRACLLCLYQERIFNPTTRRIRLSLSANSFSAIHAS